MSKTIYNKNVSRPSDVTDSIFADGQNLRFGEIVLCNNIDEPGIYICTDNGSGETVVQNLTSPESILFRSDIDTGSTGSVVSGDSLDMIVSKLQNQVNGLTESGSSNTTKINNIILGVGLNSDGSYSAITGSYIVTATTIADAIALLDSAITTVSGETLTQAKAYTDSKINALDKNSQAEENSVIYDVTETDGNVNAVSKHIVDIKLSGYTDSVEIGRVTSGDTLGEALSKLQGQVGGLDWTGATSDGQVFTQISETDGKLSATTGLLTSRKITGYSTTADTKVAASQTLGAALGNLQGQINSLDYTADTGTDKIFTYIEQSDGKLTISAESIVERVISGYTVGTKSAVAETDTLGEALGKLQGQINAMHKNSALTTGKFVRTINQDDGVVGETLDYVTDDDIIIVSATTAQLETLGANVKEAYRLTNHNGSQLGSWIKIYNDSSLNSVSISGDSSGGQWMIFNYTYSDGTTGNTVVDISSFVTQAQFASGITADSDSIVHGVVSNNSESVVTAYTSAGSASTTANVLSVDGTGFKVNNIQAAIDARVDSAVSLLDSVTSNVSAGYVLTKVAIANGKISGRTQTDTIHSATTASHAVAAAKVDSALTISYGSTASTDATFDGSSNATIYIPNDTSQLGNGANFITSADTVANAEKVAGKTVGNASGNVPLSNGTKNTNLNADRVDGYHIVVGSTGTTANTIYIL